MPCLAVVYNGSVSAVKRIILFVICLALLGITGSNVQAQQAFGKYFTETGHNVVGDFWNTYRSTPNAEVIFGYPITDEFATTFPAGLEVQYFQRARFEYHPELPEGQRVRLTPLGANLYRAGTPSLSLNIPGACRPFSTGYAVCYDFLTFFDQYGGMALLGNPVSAFEFLSDGRIVQYFERARFEWHPEFARGENILLADLGSLYFFEVGEDPARLTRVSPKDGIIVESSQWATSIRTLAFVGKAVALPTDTQNIYIIVQDQAYAPLPGATGFVIAHPPLGGDQTFAVTTGIDGIGVVRNVTFFDQPPGSLVELFVEMRLGDLKDSTKTSFRIWR